MVKEMGKRIIPPQDPERLRRILDDRTRTIGVDLKELDRQAKERKERELTEAQARALEDAEQLRMAAEIERLHAEAQDARRKNAEMLFMRQREQAMAKAQRDACMDALYRNEIDTQKYFGQFGTSHR